MDNVIIREGTREDLQCVLELIKELAFFENASDQVSNTIEQMEQDGFGLNPIYGFFVVVKDGRIVGLSLYYFRYSTWKGKRLYLEDIIVTEKERGNGLGKLLFEKTMKLALEKNCTGIMWQVLEWNKPAIEFYKKYDARLDSEWLNCHLEAEQISAFLENN
jgi:GNAT superfamily N-acetyltransferase